MGAWEYWTGVLDRSIGQEYWTGVLHRSIGQADFDEDFLHGHLPVASQITSTAIVTSLLWLHVTLWLLLWLLHGHAWCAQYC